MSIEKKERTKRTRREVRVRRKIKSARGLLRVTVFRSLNHIYAQLIDDVKGVTLASSSSLQAKDLSGDKKTVAHAVGALLADQIKALGFDTVVFDRGRYRYHGRVKALADGLREGSINI